MITLGLVIYVFLFIYFLIAFFVFMNFIIRPYNMTLTMKDTKIKTELHGWRKIKWFFFFSLIWPFVIYLNKE